ncbi:MAG: hypothetical protein Tsb0034_19310 [Ekhidna sp.]
MKDPFESYKHQWKDAKSKQPKGLNPTQLIDLSEKKMKASVQVQIKNIAVLFITLVGLILFFLLVAPLQTLLSHIGIGLMLGGLMVRIIIECYSIARSRAIKLSGSAAEVNDGYLSYHQYRKRIHGNLTVFILIAYTIGFYLLLLEFSLYFSKTGIILMGVSYLGAAMIFGYSIKKAIKTEMKILDRLVDIRMGINEG